MAQRNRGMEAFSVRSWLDRWIRRPRTTAAALAATARHRSRRAIVIVLGVAGLAVQAGAPGARAGVAVPHELAPAAALPESRGPQYLGWDPSLTQACHAYTAPASDDFSLGPVIPAQCDCATYRKPPRWFLHTAAEDANTFTRQCEKERYGCSEFLSFEKRYAHPALTPCYPNLFNYDFAPSGNGGLQFQSVLDKVHGVGVPADLSGSYVVTYLVDNFRVNNYYAGLPVPHLGGPNVHVNGFFKIDDAAQRYDGSLASVCEAFDVETWTCTRWGKTRVGRACSSFKVGLGVVWADSLGNPRVHYLEVVLWQAPVDANTRSADMYDGADDRYDRMQRYVNLPARGCSLAYFNANAMRGGATTRQLPRALRTNAPAIVVSGPVVPRGGWKWVDINVTGLMKSVRWQVLGRPGLDLPRNAQGVEDWSQAQIDILYVGPEIWGKGRLYWSVKQLNTVRDGD